MRRSGWISTLVVVTVIVAGGVDAAESPGDGPGPDPVLLGMSTALTGPASYLGSNMRDGVLAALDEANSKGGIQGRPLRLVVLDDSYEPSQTGPNIRKLIQEKKVLAIIGNVGTPTAVAAIPIVNAEGVPFYGAYTGAGILRKDPPDRYVVNFRASYAEEIVAMVDALIEEAGLLPTEVALFTQRDAYGDIGYLSGAEALKRHGLEDESMLAHGWFERNTEAVENGLADILFHDPRPKAIIMVGTYAPCAKFIKLAKECGLNALFLNVSFVGTIPLVQALGDQGAGTVITQVVPHPQSDLPVVRAYRAAITETRDYLGPTFGSLEGYISTQVFLKALESIEGSITRESIIDALEGLGDFDIGLGRSLHLGPDDHQACHEVWPTAVRDGQAVPIAWSDLPDILKGGRHGE